MKFILLGLLFFMGHTFAATELEKKLEFIKDKALSAKNLEAPKAPEALKSLRHFKHRKSHDHFTKNKMIVKKEKRQFKILNFIEDLKNEFGPVSVTSIDSEDPNKLKFKVVGKTPHFSITEVKFKIATPDERFRDITASVAVVDSEIVTVDISLIEPGEYKLALYIKYKLGANQKISLLRVSKSVFEKLYTESAHASLVEVSFDSSRLELDMSGSYSDFGNITSYSVKTFKDGEILSVDTFDPSVDGTIITESFLLKGTYQLELTVVDEFGDSDSVMSSEYVIENAAPSISFSVNQNEEYTNIFDIDVSQISVDQGELESVSIEVYSDNGEAENYYFPAADLFDAIKTIKTNLTGNIEIGIYAISQAGIDNFVMAPQSYLIDSPKASLFLRYSHSFISEGLSPYVKAYAFFGEDYLSDFDYFEVTITNEAGETSMYQQNDPYFSEGFIHAEVFYNSPGIYDASVVMVQKDGTRSLAFETRERFIEVDLGVANLVMDLDFQNPETSRDLRWIVNLDESSAGNYGYFEKFSCEFKDKLSDNEFVIEKEWTDFYFTIERGDYEVSCIGQTTAGLTSQNELKFSIDATNRAPEILNVDYFLVDTTWLEHHAYIEHNDPDGWIDYLIVKERYSNGVEHEYTVYDFISFSAIDLPLGTGSVDIELIAVDDEGEESEPYQFSVNFNNNAPEFDINISEIDPLLRSYKIDFYATDDGYIENYQFVATDPDGHKHTYDFYETVDFTFWMSGTWNIEVTAFDNFGKPSTKNLDLTIENSLPKILSLTIDDLSNRRYRITPASKDLDGYIVFDELIVSNPRGESQTYQLGEQSIELDFQTPGLYQLSYRVKDQDGAWSEAYLSSVEVINQIPVADFEISQISQNRFFLTSINSYDLDGEIVEYKTQFYGPSGEYIERFDANDFDIQLEAAGSWEVAHSVIDNDGASSEEKRISVEVINIAPTIELSYLEVDPTTRTYQINAEISEDYGYYNTFVKITDPQGGINEFGTGFPFEYQFESAGTWTVEGRIVDQDGVEVLNTIAIEVINQAPTIELSYELLDQETKRYRFSANVSDDFGQPTTYLKLTSPEGVVEEFETSFPVERELNIVGIWNVEARVVDVEGVVDISENQIDVKLQERIEKPVIIIGAMDTNYYVGQAITFDAGRSYALDGGNPSFAWSTSENQIGNDYIFETSFNTLGSHQVTLDLIDGDGRQATKVFDLNILAAPLPFIVVKNEYSNTDFVDLENEFELFAGDSVATDSSIISYEWDMGDGTIIDGPLASHSYENSGEYTIKLKVKSDLGAESEKVLTVNYLKFIDPNTIASDGSLFVVNKKNFININSEIIIKNTLGSFGEGEEEVIVNGEEVSYSFSEDRSEIYLREGMNEGKNSIFVRAYDLNGNYLMFEFEQYVGVGPYELGCLDQNGVKQDNVEVSVRTLDGDTEIEKYIHTASNKLIISDMPRKDIYLLLSYPNQSKYIYYPDPSKVQDNYLAAEYDFSEIISDVKFEGLSNIVCENCSYTGEGNIRLNVPTSGSGKLQRNFVYTGESKFLSMNFDTLIKDDNHLVKMYLINHRTGETKARLLDARSQGLTFLPVISAESGDQISVSLEIESLNQAGTFETVLNFFRNSFVSYANLSSGTITDNFAASPKYQIKEFELRDAEYHDSHRDIVNLDNLEYLSLNTRAPVIEGTTVHGNPIYMTFEISPVSINTETLGHSLVLSEIEVNFINNSGEKVTVKRLTKDNTFIDPTLTSPMLLTDGLWWDNSKGYFYDGKYFFDESLPEFNISELSSNKFDRRNSNLDFERSKLPAFVLPNFTSQELLSLQDGNKVEIRPVFKCFDELGNEYQNGCPQVEGKKYSYGPSGEVLIDHDLAEDRMYVGEERRNKQFPDYGDSYVKTNVKPIIENFVLLNDVDVRIGDTSNINGTSSGRSRFLPHSASHKHGDSFDMTSLNFSGSEPGLGYEALFDLKKILENDPEQKSHSIDKLLISYPGVRQNIFNYIQLSENSKDSLSDFYGEKSNFCIQGKTVAAFSKHLLGHNNHYHFETIRSGEGTTSIFSENLPFWSKVLTNNEEIDLSSNRNVEFIPSEKVGYYQAKVKIEGGDRRNSFYLYETKEGKDRILMHSLQSGENITPSSLGISLQDFDKVLFAKGEGSESIYSSDKIFAIVENSPQVSTCTTSSLNSGEEDEPIFSHITKCEYENIESLSIKALEFTIYIKNSFFKELDDAKNLKLLVSSTKVNLSEKIDFEAVDNSTKTGNLDCTSSELYFSKREGSLQTYVAGIKEDQTAYEFSSTKRRLTLSLPVYNGKYELDRYEREASINPDEIKRVFFSISYPWVGPVNDRNFVPHSGIIFEQYIYDVFSDKVIRNNNINVSLEDNFVGTASGVSGTNRENKSLAELNGKFVVNSETLLSDVSLNLWNRKESISFDYDFKNINTSYPTDNINLRVDIELESGDWISAMPDEFAWDNINVFDSSRYRNGFYYSGSYRYSNVEVRSSGSLHCLDTVGTIRYHGDNRYAVAVDGSKLFCIARLNTIGGFTFSNIAPGKYFYCIEGYGASAKAWLAEENDTNCQGAHLYEGVIGWEGVL